MADELAPLRQFDKLLVDYLGEQNGLNLDVLRALVALEGADQAERSVIHAQIGDRIAKLLNSQLELVRLLYGLENGD